MKLIPRKSIDSLSLSETGPTIEVYNKRSKTKSVFSPRKGDPDKQIPLRGDIEIIVIKDGEFKITRDQWINMGFDVIDDMPVNKQVDKEL